MDLCNKSVIFDYFLLKFGHVINLADVNTLFEFQSSYSLSSNIQVIIKKTHLTSFRRPESYYLYIVNAVKKHAMLVVTYNKALLNVLLSIPFISRSNSSNPSRNNNTTNHTIINCNNYNNNFYCLQTTTCLQQTLTYIDKFQYNTI